MFANMWGSPGGTTKKSPYGGIWKMRIEMSALSCGSFFSPAAMP